MNLLEVPGRILAAALRTLLPGLSDLEKENLLLRYQLLILQRQTKRPKISMLDRAILCHLSLALKRWKKGASSIYEESAPHRTSRDRSQMASPPC